MAEEQSKRTFVIWNGKEISDPAELPPELRPLLEDLDGDGIPDLAQQGPGKHPIIYRNKLYRHIDEVPPELRRELEQAMADVDQGSHVETTKLSIRRSLDSTELSEIEVNGRTYTSIDQVPAEHRDLVRRAMKNVPGTTDWAGRPPPSPPNEQRSTDVFSPPPPLPQLSRRGPGWLLLLAVAALAAVAYLTLGR